MDDKNLDYLGQGRVYADRQSRDLVVDTDSLRQSRIEGDPEIAGRDDWDDDDDDFGEELEGDDVEGDDLEGDDDLGDDVEGDDDLGAVRRRTRNRDRKRDRQEDRRNRKPKREWGRTIVTGDDSFTAAAAGDDSGFSIPIRLQHPFKAEDLTFDLTNVSKALVTSVRFGDKDVWSADGNGVNTSMFGSTSQLRGLLVGQKLRAGLDIRVRGTMVATAAGEATVSAAIAGLKPVDRC